MQIDPFPVRLEQELKYALAYAALVSAAANGRLPRDICQRANVGYKIKLVRRHRGLTQQQLGILIDIKNGAANRIAQYETGYRTPKAEIVEKIAKVLNVREETFYMPNDTIVDLIRTLIWYDWEHSLPFQDFGDSTQCFLLRIRLSCSHPAVKALLADWRIHRTAFENGRITSSDYLEWMLQWPPTLSAPDD